MGMVRLYLAVAVVIDHMHPGNHFFRGPDAVEVFFLISGFLISHILRKDGSYQNAYTFYTNRALRIYPSYFVVASVALILSSFGLCWPGPSLALNAISTVFVQVSNLTIFGQDWAQFIGPKGSGLAISPATFDSNPNLWRSLLVPPAWSLAVELSFYLFAPFIIRRRLMLIATLLASLMARVFAARHGLNESPWSNRCFPFELWVFLLGALSEQVWMPIVKAKLPATGYPLVAAAAVAGLITEPFVPGPHSAKTAIFLFFVAILLPGLALFQKDPFTGEPRTWDIRIGELSYPVYLVHWIVLSALGTLNPLLTFPYTPQFSRNVSSPTYLACAFIASIALAFVLERLTTRIIEPLRRRIRGRSAPMDATMIEPRDGRFHLNPSRSTGPVRS